MMRSARRLTIAAATLVVAYIAWRQVADAVHDWSFSDLDAYWNAAMRLRDGGQLYAPSYSIGAHDLYRYAPWFAWAWVPLTYPPKVVVLVAWEGLLLVAGAAAVWPMARLRTWPSALAALLFGSFLLWTAAKANAQPLVVAALVLGAPRRSGPLWVAVAASLKAAPLAVVAVYLGRREWGRAAVTGILTGMLVAPMLLYDLADYPRNPGLSDALYYLVSPQAWLAGALATFLAAIFLARSRYAWLAAGAAVVAALPRLLVYDLSFLLLASADGPGSSRRVGLDSNVAAAPTRT